MTGPHKQVLSNKSDKENTQLTSNGHNQVSMNKQLLHEETIPRKRHRQNKMEHHRSTMDICDISIDDLPAIYFPSDDSSLPPSNSIFLRDNRQAPVQNGLLHKANVQNIFCKNRSNQNDYQNTSTSKSVSFNGTDTDQQNLQKKEQKEKHKQKQQCTSIREDSCYIFEVLEKDGNHKKPHSYTENIVVQCSLNQTKLNSSAKNQNLPTKAPHRNACPQATVIHLTQLTSNGLLQPAASEENEAQAEETHCVTSPESSDSSLDVIENEYGHKKVSTSKLSKTKKRIAPYGLITKNVSLKFKRLKQSINNAVMHEDSIDLTAEQYEFTENHNEIIESTYFNNNLKHEDAQTSTLQSSACFHAQNDPATPVSQTKTAVANEDKEIQREEETQEKEETYCLTSPEDSNRSLLHPGQHYQTTEANDLGEKDSEQCRSNSAESNYTLDNRKKRKKRKSSKTKYTLPPTAINNVRSQMRKIHQRMSSVEPKDDFEEPYIKNQQSIHDTVATFEDDSNDDTNHEIDIPQTTKRTIHVTASDQNSCGENSNTLFPQLIGKRVLPIPPCEIIRPSPTRKPKVSQKIRRTAKTKNTSKRKSTSFEPLEVYRQNIMEELFDAYDNYEIPTSSRAPYLKYDWKDGSVCKAKVTRNSKSQNEQNSQASIQQKNSELEKILRQQQENASVNNVEVENSSDNVRDNTPIENDSSPDNDQSYGHTDQQPSLSCQAIDSPREREVFVQQCTNCGCNILQSNLKGEQASDWVLIKKTHLEKVKNDILSFKQTLNKTIDSFIVKLNNELQDYQSVT